MIEELAEMLDISTRLSAILDFPGTKGMPPDVTEAVRAAKRQMEGLPLVIEDLNAAYEHFQILSTTIYRMEALAREASKEEGLSPEERHAMNEEFGELAYVVARQAGQAHFNGTSLSLLKPSYAKAAHKVLSYLIPVVNNLDQEISGQKSLVVEAIAETINFMAIVTRCYPEAEGIETIIQTLERIKLPKNISEPIAISPILH
ncbi:MAG: hypothetical protein LBE38_09165 [Deltaproteobacteria bacterium]|nr:hypothetical protein [Deltaproteobacteria bacterium]